MVLAARDNARCVEVNRCVTGNVPAPQYEERRPQAPQAPYYPPQAPHYGDNYADPNGAWNCASPEGCGCSRGGCEMRDYFRDNYNNDNGGD